MGIPEIYESEATGIVKEIYEDIKKVLKVPEVNLIFRTLACYPEFLGFAWSSMRKNLLTTDVQQMAAMLRYPPTGMELSIPRVDWMRVYPPETLNRLSQTVRIFNIVNPKLLLMTNAWGKSLAGRPVNGTGAPKGYVQSGIPFNLSSVPLIDVEQAPPKLRYLLQDMAAVHHAKDVASDYRALAYYPQFLSYSWRFLKPYLRSMTYIEARARVQELSLNLIEQLPYPVDIHTDWLKATYSPQQIVGLIGTIDMFQNYLPGLLLDGKVFRDLLGDPPQLKGGHSDGI